MQKNFCVDLDGTLINTDMLWESFLYQIKKNPFVIVEKNDQLQKVFWSEGEDDAVNQLIKWATENINNGES